jgi:putative ATPase
MAEIGYGIDYKYPHDFDGHFVEQQYLPDGLKGLRLWEAQNNPAETKLKDYLNKHWKDRNY